MRKIDKAVDLAIQIANDDTHGYSQLHRDGPDFDCSSLVNKVIREAGIPVSATYTGNMLNDYLEHGFYRPANINYNTGEGLQRGDVLLTHNSKSGHTAIYIGNGKIVHATGDENGGITGTQQGDQTGKEICIADYFNFPWMYVLRYHEDEETITNETYTYTVQSGDTLWGIALRFNTTVRELCELNHIGNASLIHRGDILIIRKTEKTPIFTKEEIDATKKVLTYVLEKGVLDALAL